MAERKPVPPLKRRPTFSVVTTAVQPTELSEAALKYIQDSLGEFELR